MGGTLTTRRNTGVETVDIAASNAYRYPPKTGQYFGTHFIMGGERFDSPQPGEYLFGENEDLNFLGNKPIPFPYPVPGGNEPTKTLKSLVYIRKDSLRLVKSALWEKVPLDKDEKECSSPQYNIEFTFDADCRCTVTIYYLATEEVSSGQLIYHAKDASMTSETYHYKKGAGQVFSQSSHIIDPSRHPADEWLFSAEKETIPVVIQCCVEEEEHAGHCHVTFASIEKTSDNNYSLKPLKQKQFVDGLSYLLQEIYGIENKNMERSKLDPDDDVEDSGAECVICMSDMRDTLILPCRHLCLCSACAESLRYQASMCPICRVKFRALLQIRAMRKKLPPSTLQPGENTEETAVSQEGVPAGYEAVTLIEALNGQCVPPPGESGPPMPIVTPGTMFTLENSKKKPSQVKDMTRIEYQKEMDPEKDLSVKTKPDKQTNIPNTEVAPEVVTPQVAEIDEKSVTSPKPADIEYYAEDKTVTPPEPEEDYTNDERKKSASKKSLATYEDGDGVGVQDEAIKLYKMATMEMEVDERGDGKMIGAVSLGHMADDEHEDTSEAEPEPDYDDPDEDQHATEDTGKLDSYETGVVYHVAGHGDDGQYHALSVIEHMNLSDAPGSANSSTEASSYGSNSSSQALLTHVETPEESVGTKRTDV
ncbi:probable E3 ubiquitin-protein ligase MGRN1 [Gigantopelta aegis]|uniref:probable E3 ubiquitin-protein ligase MGRN1 n=1 Tax=Gigantopelta aegis TaxID=1735272 RepID=UPI001B88802B|nr:probable E3 ubiquitin-protein ligase MGRN1 [Gigantopelta aegis]XP_041362307.1 probable E3 ubiquitin-protein ligase MGRN1 [Gigantopelta aegis]